MSSSPEAVPYVFSRAAQFYHSLLAKAREEFDLEKFDQSRQTCLRMLQYPSLPIYTRIETYQLLVAIRPHGHAIQFLQSAADLIAEEERNQGNQPTQILREFRQINEQLTQQEEELWACEQKQMEEEEEEEEEEKEEEENFDNDLLDEKAEKK